MTKGRDFGYTTGVREDDADQIEDVPNTERVVRHPWIEEYITRGSNSRFGIFSLLLVATGFFILTLGLWGLMWVINTYDLMWPIRDLGLLVGVFAAVSIGTAAVQAYQNRP